MIFFFKENLVVYLNHVAGRKREKYSPFRGLGILYPRSFIHQVSGLRKSMNTTKGPCGCYPVVIRRGGVL